MNTINGPHFKTATGLLATSQNRANKETGGGIIKTVACSLWLLPLLLGVSGCISSSNPSPPSKTTIVVPNNTTVICSDGSAPPCR